MAIRVTHKVRPQIYADTNKKNVLFAPDDTLSEVVIDSFTKHSSNNISVAASASENLPLGDITAIKGMYLQVDADCTVKLNGGTETIQLRAQGTTSPSAKLFIEADINQVNVTAGSAILNGTICLWGS